MLLVRGLCVISKIMNIDVIGARNDPGTQRAHADQCLRPGLACWKWRDMMD